MALRSIVSKSKRRFVDSEAGFDLDLTYITERIIAMGYPSSGSEAYFRNPATEVQRFFETRHAGHYKIYNLCSERTYSIETIFPRVERFPFDDHNPPTLELIWAFCQDAKRWLNEHSDNVVGVHCKAGKGRTGVMVACLLQFLGTCPSAMEALRFFGETRTHNGKGVTIPSQQRYVWYWEQVLVRGLPRDLTPFTPTFKIVGVRLVTVPNFDIETGSDPYFLVDVTTSELYKSRIYDYRQHVPKIRHYKLKERCVDMDVSAHALFVRGNVRITFYDKDISHADDHMFHLSFHTAFIEGNFLCFEKSAVDSACKDKACRHFDPAFVLELFFERVPASTALGTEAGYHARFPSLVAAARRERIALKLPADPAGAPAASAAAAEATVRPMLSPSASTATQMPSPGRASLPS